jgi:hypothetical protein
MSNNTNQTNPTSNTTSATGATTTTSAANTSSPTKPTGVNVGAGMNETASTNTNISNTSNTGNQNKSTGVNEDSSKQQYQYNKNGRDRDFYHLLGVSTNASQSAIEQAYKKLASKWHPSRNSEDRLGAQRTFNDVTHAFSVLSNPARRDHYDQMISHHYTKDEAFNTFDRFFK